MRLQLNLRDDVLLFYLVTEEEFQENMKRRFHKHPGGRLKPHLEAVALVVAAGRGPTRGGGGGGGGGGGVALGPPGPLAGGQREGEGGEEGRSLTQEAVDGVLLLHGPIGGVSVGLCCVRTRVYLMPRLMLLDSLYISSNGHAAHRRRCLALRLGATAATAAGCRRRASSCARP